MVKFYQEGDNVSVKSIHKDDKTACESEPEPEPEPVVQVPPGSTITITGLNIPWKTFFTDSQWESYNVQGYTPPHNVDFSGNWYPNGTNAGKDMYVDSNNKFGLFNDSRSNRRNFGTFIL